MTDRTERLTLEVTTATRHRVEALWAADEGSVPPAGAVLGSGRAAEWMPAARMRKPRLRHAHRPAAPGRRSPVTERLTVEVTPATRRRREALAYLTGQRIDVLFETLSHAGFDELMRLHARRAWAEANSATTGEPRVTVLGEGLPLPDGEDDDEP